MTVPAALGVRTHSGWAVVVALGGKPEAPSIVDRRRIVLADATVRGSSQPYHAAEKMQYAEASAFVRKCTAFTRQAARSELRSVVKDLQRKDFSVVACGNVLGSGRAPKTLRRALASHTMLHTAEGELYRDAVTRASGALGLAVAGLTQRDAYECACTALRMREADLVKRLGEFGKLAGAPWTQDQKLAALAAWIALCEAAPRKSGRKSTRGGR